jgi:hypothetical protein
VGNQDCRLLFDADPLSHAFADTTGEYFQGHEAHRWCVHPTVQQEARPGRPVISWEIQIDSCRWIKGRYYETKADDEVLQSRTLAPDHEEILSTVCQYYGVDEGAVYRTKRGAANEPRKVSIYLVRRLRRDTLKEIGRQFKIEKYSSVSSIIERVKRQMDEDAGFRKRIDELSSTLTKGQRQI